MFGDIVFVQSESNTTWVETVVDEVIDDKHIHVTYNLGGLIFGSSRFGSRFGPEIKFSLACGTGWFRSHEIRKNCDCTIFRRHGPHDLSGEANAFVWRVSTMVRHRRRKEGKCWWNCSGPTYCSICWDKWTSSRRSTFLDCPLVIPEPYEELAPINFAGETVHIMQIGLGTFGTFVRPDEKWWMAVLLEASSWQRSNGALKAIGIDPLEESVGLHQAAVSDTATLSFLLAAIGEASGQVSLFCLPRIARSKMREKLQNEALWKRVEVDASLAYMENMSSIGSPHRDYEFHVSEIASWIDLEESLMEERIVPIYTFAGALSLHNASGCEVLAIDAEGTDCAIIRSMLECCKNGHASWPWVIRFETRRLGDFKEKNVCSEEQVIESLQEAGYLLVDAGLDAVLVHHPSLRSSKRLAQWADHYYPLKCWICDWYLYPSGRHACSEAGKGYSQWRYDVDSRWVCRWCDK